MKSELELMLQLRPASEWQVPVLLTVAQDGTGIDALVDAIARHQHHLDSSGDGPRRAAAGRRTDFVAALRDEVSRRIDRALAEGPVAAVAAAVEGGELDPYAALRRVLADPHFARALTDDGRGEGER
jgi:LAO/AO transport system kinase